MSHAVSVVGRHQTGPTTTRPVTAPVAAGVTRPADGRGAGGSGDRRPRRVLRSVARLFMNLLVVASLMVFLFLAVGPHVLGYRTSTMLTGSMEPEISPGDVVVTVARPAEDLRVGDVITYQIPVEDKRVETHRVTQVLTDSEGMISIRTKGDANTDVDPWTAVLADDTVWEVHTVVPELGHAIQVLRTPVVHDVVKWVALAGLLLLGLTTIWGRERDTTVPG